MSPAAIAVGLYIAVVVGALIWLGRDRGRYDSSFTKALEAAHRLDRMP